MSKHLGLFLKILIILLILVIVLPQLVDNIIKFMIIEEHHYKPKGNSTFVLSPNIEERHSFTRNLAFIVKCFMK